MIQLSMVTPEHLPILVAIRLKPATSHGEKIQRVLGTTTARHSGSTTPVCFIHAKGHSLIYKVLQQLLLASPDVTSGPTLAEADTLSLMRLAVA